MPADLDHAPHCARSPLNVVDVVIRERAYTLTRCAVCGAQSLINETDDS